ncbi:peroxynitrite isomerase THAP4-like isoform X2 [Megalops cyprinoides]|uniref:peroxynitrite isomerase THAP4-like isoform X2 n=1 Tax=Megalops cyprinoides TaxID=118141 RepID=UPI0018644B98|nr:peroxynitrite isomerase THAP4-like isoform X2 [Megalops cyprinoides]
MSSCAVPGCRNHKKVAEKSTLSFHRFPTRNAVRCRDWLARIRNKAFDENTPLEKLKSYRVCSQHFTEDDFKTDYMHLVMGTKERRELVEGAVPSIFPWTVKSEPDSEGRSPSSATEEKRKRLERHNTEHRMDAAETSWNSEEIISVVIKEEALQYELEPELNQQHGLKSESRGQIKQEDREQAIQRDSPVAEGRQLKLCKEEVKKEENEDESDFVDATVRCSDAGKKGWLQPSLSHLQATQSQPAAPPTTQAPKTILGRHNTEHRMDAAETSWNSEEIISVVIKEEALQYELEPELNQQHGLKSESRGQIKQEDREQAIQRDSPVAEGRQLKLCKEEVKKEENEDESDFVDATVRCSDAGVSLSLSSPD